MKKLRLVYLCSITTLILIAATGCSQQDAVAPAPIVTKASAAQATTATPSPAATTVWDERAYRAAQQRSLPETDSSTYPKTKVVRVRHKKRRSRHKSQFTPAVELPLQDNSAMNENNAENASSAPDSPDILIHRYADLIRQTDDRDQLLKIRSQIADNADAINNVAIGRAYNNGNMPDANSPEFSVTARMAYLNQAISLKISAIDEPIAPYINADLKFAEQRLQFAENPAMATQWSRDVVNQAQQYETQDNSH